MKNNKKTIIIISIILGVLVLTIGLTYSIFTISKTGKNSNLVVGDVYMHYANGSNAINLTNVLPTETYDATSFFEFTIDGKNTTTNKDIWYEIILKHGDDVTGKTRIKDNLLKFTLTETKDGETTTVFDGRSYNDLTSKRIWVNTINRNTTSEVSITYRLYMWISSNTIIGNVDQDYTMEEWKNIFASIKVDVAGDFNEKNIATDEACFTTGITKTYIVNNNMTTDELNKCTTYITNLDWGWHTEETPEAFCRGIGTDDNDYTFYTLLNYGKFSSNDLTYFETNNIITSVTGVAIIDYDEKCGSDVIIPRTIKGYPVTVIGNNKTRIIQQLLNKVNNYKFNDLNNYQKNIDIQPIVSSIAGSFQNKNLTSVEIPSDVIIIGASSFLANQLTNIEIPNSVKVIDEGAFSHNQLASVDIPDSVTTIGASAFSGNQLTKISISNSVVKINDYAFLDNQLTNINIPNNVIIIGDSAFSGNQLTRIVIPNNVTTIETSAFSYNQLTSISIPDNVTTIGKFAFEGNQLVNITIGNGIQYIEERAFEKNTSSNPNLSKITINKSCTDIRNITASSRNDSHYYPWLSGSSPYTATGVTIYGSNNEVCDSY